MGVLFLKKPDDLVLAFDKLLILTSQWEPNEVGVSKHSIVFTSKKAWLIVKPMQRVLDIKFYFDEELTSERIFKRAPWGKKYAHHIRVTTAEEIDDEIVSLLRKGFEFSLA
ncbi:hypothetical protein J8281_02730 [Aquimarina sp. U1-2]|uniref:DUF5655 domain-containing protein n=1 Tax=Aquimarina sp. U1-2 TaxID=2823141 RepID=UPI001AED0A94|nr:DUF5655 domain-containing protein [Aquimarina sp. U1-2]MBP2831092.1 hypothetical protein [Aquimarina sp. U1-2]